MCKQTQMNMHLEDVVSEKLKEDVQGAVLTLRQERQGLLAQIRHAWELQRRSKVGEVNETPMTHSTNYVTLLTCIT